MVEVRLGGKCGLPTGIEKSNGHDNLLARFVVGARMGDEAGVLVSASQSMVSSPSGSSLCSTACSALRNRSSRAYQASFAALWKGAVGTPWNPSVAKAAAWLGIWIFQKEF